jgi:hypothetical protein
MAANVASTAPANTVIRVRLPLISTRGWVHRQLVRLHVQHDPAGELLIHRLLGVALAGRWGSPLKCTLRQRGAALVWGVRPGGRGRISLSHDKELVGGYRSQAITSRWWGVYMSTWLERLKDLPWLQKGIPYQDIDPMQAPIARSRGS